MNLEGDKLNKLYYYIIILLRRCLDYEFKRIIKKRF